MFIQCLGAILDKVGNHDRNLDRARGGKRHIRVDGNRLALVHCEVNLLPILQVLKVDADHAVKFREVDILLEQDFQILHGRARRYTALKREHHFAVTW